MTIIKNTSLSEQGVQFVPKLLKKTPANNLYRKIEHAIDDRSEELDCSAAEYLSSVSRWAIPATWLSSLIEETANIVKKRLEIYLDRQLQLVKANIIAKNQYAPFAVPAHQDSAYQNAESYYDFTSWITLTALNRSDGLLQLLPKSHLGKVEPAIDFWQPNFIDEKRLSSDWQNNHVVYTMNAGDAILFDRHTWHASTENLSGKKRFALVLRWTFIDNVQSDRRIIPAKKIQGFGMWNCHDKTCYLIQSTLKANRLEPKKELDTLLDQLNQILTYLPITEITMAHRAIKQTKILHRASQLHNGGDAYGKVYANLWQQVLTYMDGSEEIFNQ